MVPEAASRRLSRHQIFNLSFLLLTTQHPQISPMLTEKNPTVRALYVLLDREAVKILSAGRKSPRLQNSGLRFKKKGAGSPFISA